MKRRGAELRRVVFLGVTLGAVLVACRREPAVSLGDLAQASLSTGVGTAPSVALSTTGHRAVSWVSAPNGGTQSSLYVSVDGALPVKLTDTLGVVQAHAEAPPQVGFDRQGTLYVLYVVVKDAGRRFPISALRLMRSDDAGRSWNAPVTVTDNQSAFGSAFGAHNFHALTIAPDGTVYASWLDGREGATATYFTYSSDHGATWSKNVKVSVGETCPCCHTSVAAGRNGVVYVAWRTVLPGNVRDIVVARSADHGSSWSAPVRVHADNWVFPGCPHAGPSVQLDTLQHVHVAWWTGAPHHAGVFFASSVDEGKTFSAPITIAAQRIPMPTHVQLGVDVDNDMLVAWDDPNGLASTITVRLSKDDGASFGRPFAVSDSSHNSMHPSLTVNDNDAVVAWSQTDTGATTEGMHMEMHGGGEPMKMGIPAVGAAQVFMRDLRF